MSTPRRPASLSPARQDEIQGGSDPADAVELAHLTASALLDGGRRTTDPAVVARLLRLAQDEGLEEIAELWSKAPPTTLPGILWRLYLLHAWVHRDPGGVVERFDSGRGHSEPLEVVAGVALPPGPDEIRATLDSILSGAFRGDLSVALERAAAFCRIVAFGSGRRATETAPFDAAGAEKMTRRGGSLLDFADALTVAARLERAGKLT